MDIVSKIMTPALELGDKLGEAAVPLSILAAIALLLFAAFSFRLFKIVLPVVGIAFGYVLGYEFLTPVLGHVFKGAGAFTTDMLAGIICAAVAAVLCIKSHELMIMVAGAGIGYMFLANLAITGVRQLQFVKDVLINTDMKTAVMLGTIFSVICALTTLILLKKCFNATYIFSTAIVACVAALVIPAIFIFRDAEFHRTAVLMASDIGTCLGVILGGIQFNYHRYD